MSGGVRPQRLARQRSSLLWPTDSAPFRGRTPPGAPPTHPPDKPRYAHPHHPAQAAAGTRSRTYLPEAFAALAAAFISCLCARTLVRDSGPAPATEEQLPVPL